MSNLELAPEEAFCGGRLAVASAPVRELLYGREVVLGTRGLVVTRTLPHRYRRMVGGESPLERSPTLHGVQLWTALPDRERDIEPHFEHHPDLPVLTDAGAQVTVIVGSLDNAASPAQVYSPLVGAEVDLGCGAAFRLPLRPQFEHAVLGDIWDRRGRWRGARPRADAVPGCRPLRPCRGDRDGGQILLLGGEPFEEQIVMWWNFVGRSHDEIVGFRDDWVSGGRFGTVRGYDGDPLPAPPMPTTPLKPRGRMRQPNAEPPEPS